MRPLAIIVLISVVMTGEAWAESRPTMAVLELEVLDAGSGIDAATVKLGQSITQGLRQAARLNARRYQLASVGERSLVEMKALSGCSDESDLCMTGIGKEFHADLVLYGKIEKTRAGHDVSLTLFDVGTRSRVALTSKLAPSQVASENDLVAHTLALFNQVTGVNRTGGVTHLKSNRASQQVERANDVKESIVVAVLEATGNVALIRERAEKALASSFEVRDESGDLEAQAVAQAEACGEPGKRKKACLRVITDALALDHILVLDVLRSTDAEGKLVVTVVATTLAGKTGAMRTEDSKCVTCDGKPVLGDMVNNLVLRLLQVKKAAWVKNATILVKSNPSDATVYLGGKPMGRVGEPLQVPDGKYTVEVVKDGYRSKTQEIKVGPGETGLVNVTLEYIPVSFGQTLRKRKIWILGTGVVFLAAGIAGIAYDGTDRFEDGQQPGDPPKLKDTEWATGRVGWPAAVIGAGLIGLSVYYFATPGPGTESTSSTEKAVTVRFLGDGLGVGVSGRFW